MFFLRYCVLWTGNPLSKPFISNVLTKINICEVREQVKYIFSDDPSRRLWLALQNIFPNAEALALDPIHLPIVYEYATWRKRTPGSRLLRSIVGKFSKVCADMSRNAWGSMFCGVGERPFDSEELLARERILSSAMPKRRAAHCLKSLKIQIDEKLILISVGYIPPCYI